MIAQMLSMNNIQLVDKDKLALARQDMTLKMQQVLMVAKLVPKEAKQESTVVKELKLRMQELKVAKQAKLNNLLKT